LLLKLDFLLVKIPEIDETTPFFFKLQLAGKTVVLAGENGNFSVPKR